jgi:hypothetical protein
VRDRLFESEMGDGGTANEVYWAKGRLSRGLRGRRLMDVMAAGVWI